MKKLTISLVLIFLSLSLSVAGARPINFPETPWPLCSAGPAQIEVAANGTIAMTQFTGYILRLSQVNGGLTVDGNALALFPDYSYFAGSFVGSSVDVLNNSPVPVALAYCYDAVPTPTPSTPTPTPPPDGCNMFEINGTDTYFGRAGGTIYGDPSIEYSYSGVDWYPLDTTITLTVDRSIWFRGVGNIVICNPPQPTPQPEPEPDPCLSGVATHAPVFGNEWFVVLPAATFNRLNTTTYYYFPTTGAWDGWFAQFWEIDGSASTRTVLNHRTDGPGVRSMEQDGEPYGLSGTGYQQFYTSDPDHSFSWRFCPFDPSVTPTPTPTLTPTQTPTQTVPTRTPIRPEPMQRTATPTATRTTYPTAVAQCAQTRLAPGSASPVTIDIGAFIRTLNGNAIIAGEIASYSVDGGGLVWPEATGNYDLTALSVTDGGAKLVVEICPGGPGVLPTSTRTATPPALPCAVADSIVVPVSPRLSTLPLLTGTRFVVTDAAITLEVGGDDREVQPGNYEWQLGPGYYNAYSLTVPATVWICASAPVDPTWTPGIAPVETAACVPRTATVTRLAYAMPDLAFVIPDRATRTATITGTMVVDVTALVAFQQSVEAGISTPAVAVSTMTGQMSWQSGESAGATALAFANPTLNWLAIANPQNPAWQAEGGPLWAIEPAIGPLLPLLVVISLVSFARFALWVIDWALKLIKLVISLIDLIPFI